MDKIRLTAALVSLACLAGCALAPEYKVPDVAVPAAYKELGPWQLAEPADQLSRGHWWQLFEDPTLDSLEMRIDQDNLNLAIALSRYDAAKAYYMQADSAMYPELGVAGSATRNRQSDNRPLRGSNQPNTYDAYTVGGGIASYELDLWGRVRDVVAAGKALEEASAADLESVRLSLHAELAGNYFQLRGLDAQAKLLTDTINAFQHQLELTEHRHDEGIVSGLDVSRARTQLEEARAQRSNIVARRALYEHAIANLVGQPAPSFTIAPSIREVKQPNIPVGVPSKLLQRRPDIAAAERRAAAANAEIGAARAAFFPSLVLGAGGGVQNTAGAALLTAQNSFWSIGPSALLVLFDGGRREAGVALANAKMAEESAQYRQTVLRAFREIEDEIAILRQQRDELSSENAAVTAAQHTFQLAFNRYREGAVNYLEVVDAETAKLRSERAALEVATRGLQATVDLIRALGGGWDAGGTGPAISSATSRPGDVAVKEGIASR